MTSFITDFDMRARRPNRSWNWLWLASIAFTALLVSLTYEKLQYEAHNTRRNMVSVDTSDNIDEFRLLMGNTTKAPTVSPGEQCFTSKTNGPVQGKACKLPFLYKHNASDPGVVVEECVSVEQYVPFGAESFDIQPNATLWCATTFATYIADESETQGLWGICSCTQAPTKAPSASPTTLMPTPLPTVLPTFAPTTAPTRKPTVSPTPRPTLSCAVVPVLSKPLLSQYLTNVFWPALEDRYNAQTGTNTSIKIAENGEFCQFPFRYNGTDSFDCIDERNTIDVNNTVKFRWCLSDESEGELTAGVCGCGTVTEPPAPPPTLLPTAAPQTGSPTGSPSKFPTKAPTTAPTIYSFAVFSFDGLVISSRVQDERNLLERYSEELTMYNSKDGLRSTYQDPYRRNDALSTRIPPRSSGDSLTKHPNQQKRTSGDMYVDDAQSNYGTLSNHRLLMDGNDTDSKNVTSPPSSVGNSTSAPTTSPTTLPTSTPTKSPIPHPSTSPTFAPVVVPTKLPTPHPSTVGATVGYCTLQCHITRLFEEFLAVEVDGYRKAEGFGDLVDYNWKDDFVTEVILAGPGADSSCTRLCKLKISIVVIPVQRPEPPRTMDPLIGGINSTMTPTSSPTGTQFKINSETADIFVKKSLGQLVSKGSKLYRIIVNGLEFTQLNEGETPIDEERIVEPPLLLCEKVCIGSIFTLQPTTSPTIAASDEPATQDPGGDTAVIAATSVSVTVLVGLILFCFCRPRSLHEKSSNRGVLHTCFGTCCPRCFGDFNEGTNQSDGSKQPLGGGGGSNVADSFHPYDDTSQSKVAPSHNSGSNSFDELNIELSKLSIKHIIGHGGNGRIFKALYCGSSVAVKELFPEGQDKNAQFGRIPIAFMREMQILRKLRHPHIIQLYGCSTANDQDTGELRYLLVMELAKHSLKDLLECNCLSRAEASHQASRDSLHLTGQQPPPTPGACSLDGSDCVSVRSAKSPMKSPSVIAGGGRLTSNSIGSAQAAREDDSMLLSLSRKYKLAQQICAGCAYIHDNNMVHFDIKPGNILLDFAGNAKICDLGIAKLNMNPNDNANFTASAFGGTPPYMAPELLRGDTSRINKAVDVYAFGIILWQLFHDRPSHPRTWTVARLFNEVMVHDYRPPLDMENPEVVPVAHLIKACWDKDSENRPDFHTLLHRLSVISQIVNEGGRKDDAGGKVWQLGESVQCWAPSIKSYSLGRIVVAHADGTYNVHFDDPSLPARLLVHPTDLLPEDDARNQHKLMQQTISGLAITNIAVRNHVLQSNHRGSMQHLRLPQTSMMSIDTNPSALGHSMMNQSALSALSFTFVRKVDQNPNGKPDRNLSLGIDGVISTMGSESIGTRHNLTLGTDTSQMQSLDETFKFDGSILQMPGFFVTGEGVEFGDDGSNASVSGQSFKSGASYWESSLIQINKLGHGASGTVRVALHIPTFEIVAVKQIRFAERNVRHQMVRELKVLWKNMIGVRKAREEQLKRVKTASHDDTDGVEDNVAHSTPTLLTNPSNVKLPKSVPEDLELIPSPVVESNENTDDGDVEFGGCEQIVLLHDAYLDAETQSVNLVLEYMNGGSLQDLVDAMQEDECNLEYIEEKVMSRITRDILLAIRFLHRNHLLHLDIKPANVLVNLNGEAKLADFGLARQLEESGHFKATTFKGSARYMSPERLKGEAYSYPSDIWSLGLTLMTCVLGRYPIESSGVNREVFSDTSRGSGSSPETHSQGTPAKPRQPRKQQGTMAYWELLSQLENEANVRLETYDVDNKFTPELKSFLRCCLVVDPDERGTAEYLLQHPWIVQFQHSSKSSTGVGKLPLGSWRSERESDTETNLIGVNATAGSCLLSDDDDLAPGASGQSADSWMAPMSSPESVPSKKSTELDSGDEVDGERVEAAKYLLEDITKHVVQQLSQSPEKMSMFSGLNVAQLRPGVDNELPLSTSRVEHLAQQLGLPAKLVEAKFEEAAIALRYPTVDDAESMRAARVVDTMPPQGNGSGSVSPKRWNKMKDEGSLTTSEIVVNSELSPSLNLPSGPVEPEKSSRKYRKPRQSSDSSWSQRSASSFSSPLAKVLSKVTGGNKSKGKSDEPSQEDLSEEGKVAAPGSILGTLT